MVSCVVDLISIGGRCLSASALGSVSGAAHLGGCQGGTCLHPFDQVVPDQQGGSDGDGDGEEAVHGVVCCLG